MNNQTLHFNHQILLSTLLRKGISGTALQWFESYLSDRSFKVSWRGEVSKSQNLATGVPQGSVLGPLLFSVYMASGSVIQKHGFSYHCYADDTQLYLSFHPDDPVIAARISTCLTDISCWMKDHHLQLNLAKTELFVVSANPSLHHNFTIQLGSSTITPSKTNLVSWHLCTWVRFLARHEIRTNNYILLRFQFPKETNTRGSKALTPFTTFHTNLQSFD